MNFLPTEFGVPDNSDSLEKLDSKQYRNTSSDYNCEKIKVFISSKSGVEKYDKVRAKLKNAIEQTQLANVYLFEAAGASTVPAGKHYETALEDSDVCIFLIDNADGIPAGVQVELNVVKKYQIKALYYFCDETKKEPTAVQQSLMGAHYAKSKTVHSFEELSENGAKDLIEDITNIYQALLYPRWVKFYQFICY